MSFKSKDITNNTDGEYYTTILYLAKL